MSKKSSTYNGGVMDACELDPCLAAESRMKQNLLSDRVKKIFFLLLAVIFILACLGLLFLFISNTGDMDENYDEDPITIGEEDQESQEKEELDSEGTLYGRNNIQKSSIIDSSEDTRPKVFFTPPSSTISPPVPKSPGTTIRIPYLVAVLTTQEVYKLRDDEISIVISTTTTSSTPSTSSTTSTTEESTTKEPETTPATKTTKTPPYYRWTTPFGQPTVSVSYWNSLQTQPTNVPVTEEVEKDCMAHREYGLGSGIYKLSPDGLEPFYAFCDMETDGGGWTVIQRRLDGQEDFHKKYYKHYEAGFGNLRGNHWLGLRYVHRLAPLDQDPQILRIELRGDTCSAPGCSGQSDDGFWWGEWDFSLGSHFTQYTLSVSDFQLRGNMSNPTANKRNTHWEAMSNGMKFTSMDQDNDESKTINCAQFRSFGGWWHRDCTVLSLNGKYGDRHSQLRYLTYYRDGAEDTYYIKPRQTLMMIRPRL